MDIKIISLEEHNDGRGTLVSLEQCKNIPFQIKRVYYIYDTGENVRRGRHAHINLRQVLICVKGWCKIRLDDGKERKEVLLDRPNKGLVVEPLIWHEMFDFSKGSVLVGVASEFYDESDYIRDYNTFMKYISLKYG